MDTKLIKNLHRFVFCFVFCRHLKKYSVACTLHVYVFLSLSVCVCALRMNANLCRKCNKCVYVVWPAVFSSCAQVTHTRLRPFSTISFALFCVCFFFKWFCIFLMRTVLLCMHRKETHKFKAKFPKLKTHETKHVNRLVHNNDTYFLIFFLSAMGFI